MLSTSSSPLLSEAQQFIDDELIKRLPEFDKNHAVSVDFIRKMCAKGYLGVLIPKIYGGLAANQLEYGRLTELFGKISPAVRSLLTVHASLVSEAIVRFGTKIQKNRLLPCLATGEYIGAFALSEPEVGSDAKSVQTTWREEKDCFVLSGVKKWITYGDLATIFIIVANNKGAISTFLVPRGSPGLSSTKMNGMMVGAETYLASLELNDVRVPKENLLGKLGMGFEYVVSYALDAGRYSIAWSGLAIAQAALEAMVVYARERKQFGQKLAHFQLVKGMIADAVTQVHGLRAQCEKAGMLRDQGHASAVSETAIAKYLGSKVAVKVTNDALQIHGANGFTKQYPIGQLYYEAKVLETIEGSSQIQQEIISSFGLSQYFRNRKHYRHLCC